MVGNRDIPYEYIKLIELEKELENDNYMLTKEEI